MKKVFTPLSILFSAIILFPPDAKSQQQVIVGTGTQISVFSPLNRTNDYCVYEVIYLASDIGVAGNITHLAFERVDGSDTATIENVDIYMRHSVQTTLSANTLDTTIYDEHVYSGTFPNDIGSGWREVMLNIPFVYNGTDNLQVLVVKGYQPAVANTPVCVRWYYTNISPSPARARRYYGDSTLTASTPLTTTQFTSNVRLTIDIGTGSVEIIPEAFNVYPNPASDELKINPEASGAELKIELVEMFNTLGEKVFSQKLKANSQQPINVSFLAPGIYFVKVRGEHEERITKFVKE